MTLIELDHDKVHAELLERQRVYTIQYAVTRVIAQSLRMQHERAVSKRIATALQKELPGYYVSYSGGTITIHGGQGDNKLGVNDLISVRLEQDPETLNFDANRTLAHWSFARYEELSQTLDEIRTVLKSLGNRLAAYNQAVRQVKAAHAGLGPIRYVTDSSAFKK